MRDLPPVPKSSIDGTPSEWMLIVPSLAALLSEKMKTDVVESEDDDI